jgi:hypothetical protein
MSSFFPGNTENYACDAVRTEPGAFQPWDGGVIISFHHKELLQPPFG